MDNFLNWTDERIEDLVNRVYNGVVSRDALPQDLYNAIVEKMIDAVIEGFGDADDAIFDRFTDNMQNFSFAKTFQQVNDMENFIFGDDGNVRPFSAFKKNAEEIFEIYNGAWLETEYNTAVSITQSAAGWVDIERDKEDLPLLQYQTVGDERVRQSHRELDNIIRPVDDPFWDEFYPPNDWNCRCIVLQLEEGEVTDISNTEFGSVSDLFKQNAAKDGKIFNEETHPYFNGLGDRRNEF